MPFPSNGGRAERGGLWLHIPIGGVEVLVAQIARQQNEAVGQWRRLASPTRNPVGGKAVAQIIKTRSGPGTVTEDSAHQALKSPIGSAHPQGPAQGADKEVVG